MIKSSNWIFGAGILTALLGAGVIISGGCGGAGGLITTGTTATDGGTRGCTAQDYSPNYVGELRSPASTKLRYWDGFPLRIFVRQTQEWNTQRENAAFRGFDTWSIALQDRVTFTVVTRESDADIILSFVQQNILGDRTVGLTTSTYEVNTFRMLNAEIQLAVNSPFEGQGFDLSDIQSTALHEMGHALGIAGHSPSEDDVMYFANTKSELSASDINTLLTSYCNSFGTRSRQPGKRAASGPVRTEVIP